jgi:hypothetical protein
MSLFKSTLEPGYALSRTTVRKTVGYHLTLLPFLNAVIAQRAGSVQAFLKFQKTDLK